MRRARWSEFQSPWRLGYDAGMNHLFMGVVSSISVGLLVVVLFVLVLYIYRQRRLIGEVSRARAQLQASEARFRLLAENASDLLWVIRLPDLRFTYLSPAVTRLRGVSVEQAMQESFLETIVPEERDAVRQLIDLRLKAFKAGAFDATDVGRAEVHLRCADGGKRAVEITATLIVDDNGSACGIQGISRDISKRRRRERARESREAVLSALARGTRGLFNAADKNKAMDQMLAGLGQAVEADRVYVYENHRDETDGRLLASMRYEWVGPDISAQIDNPKMQCMDYREAIPNWVEILSSGRPAHGLVADLVEPERGLLESQGIVSIVVVPIFLDGEFWGQIGFDDCSRPHQWSQLEIDALEIAAATVGAAIRGIRAEQELKRQVSTDSLTGLLSRRAFLGRARQAYARADSAGQAVSLLIMDLDHFKAVNDNHGHPVGDQALKAFARVCRLSLRGDDLIGRMGGEEFAVLLDGVNPDQAGQVAEKLRQEVESAEVELKGVPLRLTVSIGMAMSGSGESDFAELLKRADQALYRAKRAGRNRVEMAKVSEVLSDSSAAR